MWAESDAESHAQDPTKLKRLLSAVVVRAISDYVSYRGGRRQKTESLYLSAKAWLMSDVEASDTQVGYTFVQACHVLDLDVGAVRAQLDVLRVQDLERFRRVMAPSRDSQESEPEEEL